jgi:hypothetical protein
VIEKPHDPRGAGSSVQVGDAEHPVSERAPQPGRSAIATSRVNVLVQGSRPFISRTLATLRRDLPRREFIWPDRPMADTARPTVLVGEVGQLSAHALDALAHLIADNPQLQVIVTSSVVVYELVERGQFPADLYYRLNVVMLTDDEWPASRIPRSS